MTYSWNIMKTGCKIQSDIDKRRLDNKASDKKTAIVQSNYIPWKGYFDLIGSVDEFILYDDVQYTRRDWRNRNQIKTPQGPQWLTIPVSVKGKYQQAVRDVEVVEKNWPHHHWASIKRNYCRSPYFDEIKKWLQPLYHEACFFRLLSEINRHFIEAVCRYLGIATKISVSSDFQLLNGRCERLVDLCLQTGSTEYVSGPAAKGYIESDLFVKAGVKLTWFDYLNYREYPQLWGEFTHHVSIIDLLFNCGRQSKDYMRYSHR